MMPRRIKASELGFSLVEVLIVVGLLSVIGMGIASMVSDMSSAQVALQEKFATIEAGNGLSRAFADPAICSFQLQQGTGPYDVSVPNATISYPEIRLGSSPTSPIIAKTGDPLPGYPANKMVVQSITLKNIALIGGSNYSGDLEVIIDPTTIKKPLKPFGVRNLLFFATLPTTIEGCGGGGIGDWEVIANVSGAIHQATSDGLVIITSAFNRGIRLSTGLTAVTLTTKANSSARNAYGQGYEVLSIPLKKDEFWSAQSTNGGSDTGDSLVSVFFRRL